MRDVLVGNPIGQVEQAFGRGLVRRIDRAGQRWQPALHPARRDRVAGDLILKLVTSPWPSTALRSTATCGPVEIVA